MNTFSALKPIDRRALKIPYLSPLICQLTPDASGSAGAAVSIIDIEPTYQLAGPVLAVELLETAEVSLTWGNTVPHAYAYVIYRADNENGPYLVQAAGVVDRFLVDNPPLGTYFYKVTALEPNFGETMASNTVSVTVS